MTLEHVVILIVTCFLSMFLIIVSCINCLEKRIDKYHRQELEAIDELKKSIENKDSYFNQQLPAVVKSWQYEEFDPNRWTSNDVITWYEHPDNMNEEVKQDGMC